MSNQSKYQTFFSNSKRNSLIPTVSGSDGNIVWSHEHNSATEDLPNALFVWQENIVLVTLSNMILFDQGGKRQWKRTRLPGSHLATVDELLYYESEKCKLDSVNLKNELLLDNAPFPSVMDHEFRVQLLWPRKHDYVAVVYWPGYEPDQAPQISWRITMFGDTISDQAGEYEESMSLAPLFIPEQNRLVISTQDVICIDIQQNTEMPRFTIPITEPIEWSSDNEGLLCIIGYDNSNKVLVAMSLDGEEKWRWSDQSASRWVTGQPPIRSGNGRVYALTGPKVLAVEQGRLLWQYEVKDETLTHGSSLADGSLLVTAGKTLIHLDSEGNERFKVSLEDEILTPPVVDADGNIYVATATHLVKIN